MNSHAITLVVIVWICLSHGHSSAAIPEKYQTILDRNPFALQPPLSLPPETISVVPTVDVRVTGFSTMGDQRRVYFTIPPKTPKDHYQFISLSEGQNEAGVEVIKIRGSDGIVQVRNGGIELALSLKENGFQAAKPLPAVTQSGPVQQPVPSVAPIAPALSQMNNSPVYNHSAIAFPTGNAYQAGSGGVQQTAFQMASNSRQETAAPNIVGGGTQQNNFPSVNPVYNGNPIASNTNPVLGGNKSPEGKQANFPPEKTFNSPEEAIIIAESEAIYDQSPKNRDYWVKYYQKLGWPADRPLPTDVAAQLSPLR